MWAWAFYLSAGSAAVSTGTGGASSLQAATAAGMSLC